MSRGRLSLLLVEDNLGDVRLIREMMREIPGVKVAVAGDLGSALERCATEEPDVVLLDLGLPDSDGLDTLEAFQRGFPRLPVVVLTGNDDLVRSLEAVKLGAQDYLVKGAVDGALLLRAASYARERKRGQVALREREEQLRRTNQELQDATAQLIHTAKLAALGELAAGIAHELNQPLNTIGLICQSLCRYQRDYKEEEVARELAEVMKMVRSMKTIIGQLNTFNRRSAGRDHRPLEINTAVAWALNVVVHQIEDQEIELRQELAGGLPEVNGDMARLQQVFINLLVNARDALTATPASRRRIEIRTAMSDDGRVKVEVQDSGPGMTGEVKEKLFTPFFTTKEPGRGTGLGLTIVRRILDDHQGVIEVDSKAGEGTTFRVLLPVAK